MSQEIEKSITEQIYDEMISRLSNNKLFSKTLIDSINDLVRRNELSKSKQVAAILDRDDEIK